MTTNEQALWNAEKMHEYLSRAIYCLEMMENEWEEGALTDDQENAIIDQRDQLEDLLYEIQDRITKLEGVDDEDNKSEEESDSDPEIDEGNRHESNDSDAVDLPEEHSKDKDYWLDS